jgi:hypothetical protein
MPKRVIFALIALMDQNIWHETIPIIMRNIPWYLLIRVRLQVEEQDPIVAGISIPRGVVVPFQQKHGHGEITVCTDYIC